MMMYYDLHIHSCLSPCADDDMTPNNIINMSKLKGLDIVSITDHNSTINLAAFCKVAEKNNIIFIPGVEVETSEEIHILLYFRDRSVIGEFQKIIDENLPDLKVNEKVYGNQYVVDENDSIQNTYEKLLLQPLNIDIVKLYEISMFYNMVFVPAHINRQSYGILGRLGGIPNEINQIKLVEVSSCGEIDISPIKKTLSSCIFLHSSDAHSLGNINERVSYLDSEILYTIFF
mgnify:CR=1 FL=1